MVYERSAEDDAFTDGSDKKYGVVAEAGACGRTGAPPDRHSSGRSSWLGLFALPKREESEEVNPEVILPKAAIILLRSWLSAVPDEILLLSVVGNPSPTPFCPLGPGKSLAATSCCSLIFITFC